LELRGEKEAPCESKDAILVEQGRYIRTTIFAKKKGGKIENDQ